VIPPENPPLQLDQASGTMLDCVRSAYFVKWPELAAARMNLSVPTLVLERLNNHGQSHGIGEG